MTLEVTISNKKDYIITLYRSPSQTFDSLINKLEKFVINITSCYPHFVKLVGCFKFKIVVSEWHNNRRRFNIGKPNLCMERSNWYICSNRYFITFLKLHWPYFCQPVKLSYRFWYSSITAPKLSSSCYIL